MKKLFAILTSILLLCAMIPLGAIPVSAATSGTTGDCTWVLDGTHLIISGEGEMGNYSPSAPWGRSITSVTIEDGVTNIGSCAFYECESLTSVTIPDSIITIGDWAFDGCTSLTSVDIPYGVTTIGKSAFYCCESLTSVDIPYGVTTIGERAFFCTSLTSVTIPDSVTTIGEDAFRYCTSLTSVDIPDSVTTIGGYAFYHCDSLTSVTIGDGVTNIGEYAFFACESLTSVHITDIAAWCAIDFGDTTSNPFYYGGNLYLKDTLATDLVIPYGVTAIGDWAFHCCTSLTTVTIPDSVTTIGRGAFMGCTSLAAVTIPDSVSTIGNSAFFRCDSLTDVYYAGSEEDRSKISIGSNNSDLTSATWHYNYVAVCDHVYDNDADPDCNVCGAVRAVADRVGVSVSEDVSGLAMQFKPEVEGIAEKSGAYMQADYTNATYHGYKLIEMGVVASNGVCETTIKGEYLYEWQDGTPTFAFRVINIPADKLDVVITMTPYYVVEIDGVATTIYGTAQTGAYADVAV